MNSNVMIRMVQALVGAVVLTLLMQVFAMTGFGQYIWMLFLPLLLFFALGADFKKVPSMIICYICGVVWAFISGMLQGVFSQFAPQVVVDIVPTIIVIFIVLTVHENLLAKTVLGNIPALFLGMCTTFFVFMMGLDLTPLHLVGFYLYGLLLAIVLVMSGMGVCSLLFGKERAFAAIVGEAKGKDKEPQE